MANQILGTPVKRREDPVLLTGEAKFIDDITLPNMAHMAILYSTEAHAYIRNINTQSALQMPGVIRVFTGADTQSLLPLPCIMNPGGERSKFPPHPYGLPGAQTVLATDRVRYVGEFVAVVVAETRQQAYDALTGIQVDYEPLPAVTTAEDALKPDAPQLHESVPGNLNQYNAYGDKEATERAIAAAEVVVRQRLRFPRIIHNAVEPRGTLAAYDPDTEEYTLWTNTQIPHGNRFLLCQLVMGIPYNKLRVIVPEIGGSYGSKGYLYADTAITLFVAKAIGRPVKWVDTRKGVVCSTVHARDQVQDVAIAGNRDGKITALHSTLYAALGGYPATNGPATPTALTGRSITGAYAIDHPFSEIYCAFANMMMVGPLRGAGRAEATYLTERMVDLFAQEIGMDPAEVRRKNMVPPDRFPFDNGLGWTYDSGHYTAALDKALGKIGYASVPEQKAEAKARGKRLGVGLGSYVAIGGVGPSSLMNQLIGLIGSTWGSVVFRVQPTGAISIITGSQPHGQGHVTTMSQVASEVLGVDMEQIEVLHSDTRGAIFGQGSYGSRTYSVEAATVYKAAQEIKEKATRMAAHILGVSVDQIETDGDKYFVKGAPERVQTLAQIAIALWYAWDLPAGMDPGLEVITFFDPPNFNFPSGTHAVLVEVDEETGEVDIVKYVAVDDYGNVGNPAIVDAQTHGNIHLGISQALYEGAIWDEKGHILNDDYSTYPIARPSKLPHFETERMVTPSPVNPLGAKGAGDVANISTPPAIVSAVCDALGDLGIKHIDIPLTPEKVWRAIQEAKARQ